MVIEYNTAIGLTMEYTKKLKKYLNWVEVQTGRKIVISERPPEELYKMKSAFIHHPKHLMILLASGSVGTDPEIEQSIAHEATHGLLVYKMGYCLGFFTRGLDAKEKKLVTLVFTMVSDIVVNKMIQDEGFMPYNPKYPAMVQAEIHAMENGIKLYDRDLDPEDPSYYDKHLAFRYTLAWGFLKYFDLDEDMLELLRNFSTEFQMRYTDQFQMSLTIQGIIMTHDIFSTDGYRRVVDDLLVLWNLAELVELRSVSEYSLPDPLIT